VTIASDSTGVLSVDDNGGVLTSDGTVVAAGTQTVAGTVAVSTIAAGTVAISTIAAGTVAISTIGAGTVVATAAGTQTVTHGKTILQGTINVTSGSQALVTPGTGTTAYIVGYAFSAGTSGALMFRQGVGAVELSGTMWVDQYGGFARNGDAMNPVLKGIAGSVIYLQAMSGTPNVGGHFSYFVEA